MIELYNSLKAVHALTTQNIDSAGAVNGEDVDRLGFEAVLFTITMGEDAGLDSGDYITATLQHADDDGAGSPDTYAAVADADFVGDPTGMSAFSSGVFATVDHTDEDDTTIKIGYKGTKRWVRIVITGTEGDTLNLPIGACAILGRASDLKVS